MAFSLPIWLQEQKYAGWPYRVLYPLEWTSLKAVFSEAALRPVKVWLVLIPFVAGLVSTFPIEVIWPGGKIVFGGDFQPPFSFLLSYLAAVFFLFAYAIFWIRCPEFVRKHEAKYDTIPTNTTRAEVAWMIRSQCLSCLASNLKLPNGSEYLRDTSGSYRIKSSQNGPLEMPDQEDLVLLQNLWEKAANYTTRQIYRENGSRVAPILTNEVVEAFFEDSDFGGRTHLAENGSMPVNLFNLMFAPSLRIKENKEDKELIAAAAYSALYIALSESRPIARLITSVFVLLSVILGVVVVIQITIRGLLLFGGMTFTG